MSEDTKRKISESRKGSTVSEETKHKIRKANLGKKLSEETKQKMSKVKLGKTFTQEHRDNLSKSCANKKKVKQIKDGEVIRIWDSIVEAGEAIGISYPYSISKVGKGIKREAGGYQWEYVEEG